MTSRWRRLIAAWPTPPPTPPPPKYELPTLNRWASNAKILTLTEDFENILRECSRISTGVTSRVFLRTMIDNAISIGFYTDTDIDRWREAMAIRTLVLLGPEPSMKCLEAGIKTLETLVQVGQSRLVRMRQAYGIEGAQIIPLHRSLES